jgi:hypothetical protein
VHKLFEHKSIEEEWSKFMRRAEIVSKSISTSLYASILDFCFIGSTPKYQKMEI